MILLEEYKLFIIKNYSYLDNYNNIFNLFTFLNMGKNLGEENLNILRSVTKEILDSWVAHEKLSQYDTSLNNDIRSIRILFRFLYKKGLLSPQTYLLTYKIKTSSVKLPEIRYITEKDINTLIKDIVVNNDYFKNILQLKAILFFMFYTGFQPKELKYFRRYKIDLENRIVKAWKRNIPFPIKLRDLLIRYFESEEERNNVFNFNQGVQTAISRYFTKYSHKRLQFSWKMFRVSFIYHCGRKGLDVRYVKYLLGGRKTKLLEHYTEDFDKQAKMYRKKMEGS